VETTPDAPTARYRCTHCGNLTRFDVTVTRRSRSYHHYTVGGDLEIEETEVLSESIEDVVCRWCGTGTHVVAHDTEDATPGHD
jgi:predicted nucleic acid-binding Zn ribbon protein